MTNTSTTAATSRPEFSADMLDDATRALVGLGDVLGMTAADFIERVLFTPGANESLIELYMDTVSELTHRPMALAAALSIRFASTDDNFNE